MSIRVELLVEVYLKQTEIVFKLNLNLKQRILIVMVIANTTSKNSKITNKIKCKFDYIAIHNGAWSRRQPDEMVTPERPMRS